MSETVMVDDVAVERVPREQRRQNQQDEARADEPQVTVADIGSDDPTDPARMLEESRAAIQERDRQVADANRRAREAENNAARARDEAARANMARVGDRAAAVASALETAKADLAAARIAYKAAREAGDVDAELSAQEMISSATFRQNQAAGELAGYDARAQGGAQPQREPTSGAGDAPRMSEAVRAWMDDHPRYRADPVYAARARGAHDAAILSGHTTESPGYFDFIEQDLARQYGPNHGHSTGQPTDRRTDNMSGNGGGNAGPTNRGGGGGGAGGGRTVQTQFGGRVLQVHRRADGKLHIQIPQADREDWNEAAKINNMSLGEYCLEQVNVAEEMKAGGNAGWIKGD